MDGPAGPGWPLPAGGFDLSQVFRMLQSDGPVNWEVAEQVASWTSGVDPDTGEPTADPEPDPDSVRRIESLVSAAQTHTASATGLSDVLTIPVSVVTRTGWAGATLEGLHGVIEVLAGALAVSGPASGGTDHEPGRGPAEGLESMFATPGADETGLPGGLGSGADPFAGLMAAVGPVVIGVQAGTMIGFLSQHTLCQYDLPLPLTGEPRLTFVLSNIDSFAEAWSLPADDLRFALALRETVHAAQRSVTWVRDRLLRLSRSYVGAYRFDPGALESTLSSMDFSDPESWGPTAEVALDPAALLDAMRTPEQEPFLADLQRLAAVLEGYTDTVVGLVGEELVPSLTRIDEALRRHRVERGRAEAFVDRLLGLELGRAHYEQGVEFCSGVMERAGTDGLNRLWSGEAMVPTAAELDAPGLWLARIDLEV